MLQKLFIFLDTFLEDNIAPKCCSEIMYVSKGTILYNNNNYYYHRCHKRFGACFKFLDYKVLVHRYTAEGKQILSVNGCTGILNSLHVNFFSTINRKSKLRPNNISTASSTHQWASPGRFYWDIFGDLVSRHLRCVHYEGILHN